MSSSNKIKVINQPLVYEEYNTERFIQEHQKPEVQGNIFQIYEYSIHKNDMGTTRYNTICFKFSDGRYYSTNKITFNNQLCSGNAKPSKADKGKYPKYSLVRIRQMSREDIIGGDYTMPSTENLTEEETKNLEERFNRNIDGLARSNTIGCNFHKALEYEWQKFNQRLKTPIVDNNGNIITPSVLDPAEIVISTVIDKVKTTDSNNNTVMKIIDPPLYTMKIPAFFPHSKSSEKSRAYFGRLGQVYMNDDRFEAAVYDMELSKSVSKDKQKVLIEARIKGSDNDNNKQEEFLNFMNAGEFITRKSKIGGYYNLSKSSVSKSGHSLKVEVPHLIVKKHKSEEKQKGLSDESLEEIYNLDDDCFAEVEEKEYKFDSAKKLVIPKAHAVDASSLSDVPLQSSMNQQMMPPQMMNQQLMAQQYQMMMQQQMAQQQMPQQMMNQQIPQQQMMNQQIPQQMMPQQQMMAQPNPNYLSVIRNGLEKLN